MHAISVAEMLKLHGEWMESGDLNKEIQERLKITDRMAWILMKKAIEDGSIRKELTSDRHMLFGLPGWGPRLIKDNASKAEKKNVDAEAQKPQLSKSERKRLEALVEGRAEVKFAAQNFPSLQPLDDLLEIHKKMRKEAGLE